MTFRNILLTTGLLALVATTATAIPSIKLMRAGAAKGAVANIVVNVVPDGSGVNAAIVALKFDSAKAAVAAAGSVTAGPGWDAPVFNVQGDSVLVAMTRGDAGVTSEAELFTVQVTNNADRGSTIETVAGGNIGDADFNQFDIPAGVKAAVVTGKVRNLAAIPGSPSVGGGGLIAVGAGTKLYLLNPDLTDAAGWTDGKEIGGAVSGRPAFGVLNGAAVVAAGTANGNAAVFALDGTQVSNGPVAGVTGIPTAPAILPTTVVWAAQTAAGPSLVGNGAVSTGTGTVTGSPAVFGGAVVAGTSAEIIYGRIDATGVITPSAAAAVGEAVSSPAVDAAGNTAVAAGASGKVYKVNLATGALVGSPLDLAAGAPLSNPFADYKTGTALFGGTNGSIYPVTMASLTAGAAVPFGTAAVGMPIVVNGKTVAADATGKVGVPGGEQQDVAGPVGPAIAATGPAATDSIIVTTTDGSVIAVPAF